MKYSRTNKERTRINQPIKQWLYLRLWPSTPWCRTVRRSRLWTWQRWWGRSCATCPGDGSLESWRRRARALESWTPKKLASGKCPEFAMETRILLLKEGRNSIKVVRRFLLNIRSIDTCRTKYEIFRFVYAAILIFLIGHVMLKNKLKCMIKDKHIFFYEGSYLNKIPSLQSNRIVNFSYELRNTNDSLVQWE